MAMDRKLEESLSQQSEQNTVLLNMTEGVFAVDNSERILSINKAAAELFGGDAVLALGRSLPEVIRNPDLQKFVAVTLQSESPVEGDIILHHNNLTHYVQAHGTRLKNLTGDNAGAVVVLNNVTRLKKLENIRRDFVANVSHEIKTPITSIKGFVETLLDGALDNADDARHFLKIIAKHTDRLNAIVDDLLALSRLEENAKQAELDLSAQEIKPILMTAIESCATKSQKKNIQVTLSCSKNLSSSINARLLEQALVNLVDNAIKYSEPNQTVDVRAEIHKETLFLQVEDHGMGIEPQHLDRLFERFYRVDKARSRDQGGTGLGLAIVKHIAEAHGGEVQVESVLEKGSIFKIVLPQSFIK
jgi:two-component system phosphate regulon sensor histidine kinase PhoR